METVLGKSNPPPVPVRRNQNRLYSSMIDKESVPTVPRRQKRRINLYTTDSKTPNGRNQVFSFNVPNNSNIDALNIHSVIAETNRRDSNSSLCSKDVENVVSVRHNIEKLKSDNSVDVNVNQIDRNCKKSDSGNTCNNTSDNTSITDKSLGFSKETKKTYSNVSRFKNQPKKRAITPSNSSSLSDKHLGIMDIIKKDTSSNYIDRQNLMSKPDAYPSLYFTIEDYESVFNPCRRSPVNLERLDQKNRFDHFLEDMLHNDGTESLSDKNIQELPSTVNIQVPICVSDSVHKIPADAVNSIVPLIPNKSLSDKISRDRGSKSLGSNRAGECVITEQKPRDLQNINIDLSNDGIVDGTRKTNPEDISCRDVELVRQNGSFGIKLEVRNFATKLSVYENSLSMLQIEVSKDEIEN